ncbi:hypothetical protein ACQKLS_14470 [Pedobacter suwonensis]|uniref:hypothetical protein n=1 Tax=Pedobacter suwonensis TaxID=332999 RepID=UPI0025FEAC01|nr:hypothetical protein [uncultured Pedobacter sp.]
MVIYCTNPTHLNLAAAEILFVCRNPNFLSSAAYARDSCFSMMATQQKDCSVWRGYHNRLAPYLLSKKEKNLLTKRDRYTVRVILSNLL